MIGRQDAAVDIIVVETADGFDVVEQGRVVSGHADRERAEKAALDWASRRFEEGRRLVVVLG